jgi:hypothetical protein
MLVLSSLSISAEDFIYYKVKAGDTLSDILFELEIGPIYGKKGFQNLSARINNLPFNGDKIRIGDVLRFPATVSKRTIASDLSNIPSEKAPESKEHTEAKADKSFQHFIASFKLSRLNFDSDSNDFFQHSRLKTYSKPVPSLQLTHEIHWDEHFKILAFAEISSVGLYPDSQIKFEKTNFTRNNFGAGFGYSTNWSKTELRGGFYDEVFFAFTSPNSVTVDVISVPEIQLSHVQILKKNKTLDFSLGLNAKTILPQKSGSLEGKSGYGAGAQIFVGSKKRSLNLFYNMTQANAQANQTIISEIGIGYVIEGDFHD